jgi:hypothetical protein
MGRSWAIEVPLPPACPACGGTVYETPVTSQIQEGLPIVRPQAYGEQARLGFDTTSKSE